MYVCMLKNMYECMLNEYVCMLVKWTCMYARLSRKHVKMVLDINCFTNECICILEMFLLRV